MKVIFNSRIAESFEIGTFWSNRSFLYGDGVFETMLWSDGEIKRWNLHQQRLQRALDVLQMEIPNDLLEDRIPELVQHLAKSDRVEGKLRLRLQVWRKAGGKYTPSQHQADYLLVYEPLPSIHPLWEQVENIGYSTQHFTHQHALSFCKTSSSLLYVMAGLEKKTMGWDEILLCDKDGNLAEAGTSNVFWVKGGDIFTPCPSTGCVEGIRRASIISYFNSTPYEVTVLRSSIHTLEQADVVFTANALGLRFFKQWGNTCYLLPGDIGFPDFLHGILYP